MNASMCVQILPIKMRIKPFAVPIFYKLWQMLLSFASFPLSSLVFLLLFLLFSSLFLGRKLCLWMYLCLSAFWQLATHMNTDKKTTKEKGKQTLMTTTAATNVVVGCLNSIDTYTHTLWLSCDFFVMLFFFRKCLNLYTLFEAIESKYGDICWELNYNIWQNP